MNNDFHNDTNNVKDVKNTLADVKNTMREPGAVIKEKSNEIFNTTKNLSAQVFDYIKSNPYKSLGLAFIAGVGCAKLRNAKMNLDKRA